jgi:hypothetical protein
MSTTNAQWRTTRLYKDILPKENSDDRAYVTILDKIFPYTMTVTDGLDATCDIVLNYVPDGLKQCVSRHG